MQVAIGFFLQRGERVGGGGMGDRGGGGGGGHLNKVQTRCAHFKHTGSISGTSMVLNASSQSKRSCIHACT